MGRSADTLSGGREGGLLSRVEYTMPVFRNKYRYQLIAPIVGTHVYQTPSLKKGAKKCYEELRSLDNLESTHFTVLNIDTYETYQFQINEMRGGRGGGAGDVTQTISSLREELTRVTQRLDRLEGVTTSGGAGGPPPPRRPEPQPGETEVSSCLIQ